MIKKDELLIVDLGYFSKTFFEKLSSKGVFYLTRIRSNTVVYLEKVGKVKQVDLSEILAGNNLVDTTVYLSIGYKKQLKCRLVAIRLPDEIVNERGRNRKLRGILTLEEYMELVQKEADGETLTKKERELLDKNREMFKNMPITILPKE
jgi:hypothetical protein